MIEASGWGGPGGPLAAAAQRAARAAVASQVLLRAPAELTLVLRDDAGVRALNAQWRDKDAPTNVLAFANCDPATIAAAEATDAGAPLLLGDVVLALETCQAEAEAAGITVADHVAHLAVHGVLHLFGHDHGSDAEAAQMEALEARVLAGMGIANPYDAMSRPEAHPGGRPEGTGS